MKHCSLGGYLGDPAILTPKYSTQGPYQIKTGNSHSNTQGPPCQKPKGAQTIRIGVSRDRWGYRDISGYIGVYRKIEESNEIEHGNDMKEGRGFIDLLLSSEQRGQHEVVAEARNCTGNSFIGSPGNVRNGLCG